MTAGASAAKKYGFRESLAALRKPRVASMLALGFASGLPFLLTGATFGYWLRDEGTTLTAIGFLSWVGLAYTFKVLWSPFIDRLPAPFFGKLGRRRGWALISQLAIGAALVAMAHRRPARARRFGDHWRAGSCGGVRLRDPGHRRRCLAHRGGLRRGRIGSVHLGVPIGLPRRAAGDRCADIGVCRIFRLADFLRADGGVHGRRRVRGSCARPSPRAPTR